MFDDKGVFRKFPSIIRNDSTDNSTDNFHIRRTSSRDRANNYYKTKSKKFNKYNNNEKTFVDFLENNKSNEKTKEYYGHETSLTWKSTQVKEKNINHSWSEDAINYKNNIVYRLYYNDLLKTTTLEDLREEISYHISNGDKAKGYMLAFKLNTNHIRKMKILHNKK